MKKSLLTIIVGMVGISPAVAQLNGDGFYRVQNYVTERYVYITDNKGHVDVSTTSIDALAIQLWKDFDKACSDPSTVLYFVNKGGNDYDIQSQGTGINQIINYNATIRKNNDGTYFAYGSQSGVVKYLGDANASDSAEGTMSSEAKGDRRKWWITPITSTGDNYFGIKPTVTVGGKYYHPLYASFPMSAKSQGVTIYVISTYGYGMAVAEPVNGTIPAGTPCIVECGSTSPSNNRMNVGGSASAISKNQLGGVYFENYMKTHLNLTAYDKNTMRVLGKLSDGTLGFVVADLQYLPANQSYLKVPAGSPAEIRIVSKDEYDKEIGSLPSSVSLNASELKLYVGRNSQLTATIAPENVTNKHITWASTNPNVAKVDENGNVTAIAKGTTVISATTINGKVARCTVTVNPNYPEAIAISPATFKFYVGDEKQLSAVITPSDVEYSAIKWSSSDASVSVSESGLIKAVKTGSATITAKTADGKTATASITVNPVYPVSISLNSSESYIHAKETCQLVATINPSDVKDATLSWTSDNESIATVDNKGLVTGHSVGVANIKVASPGGTYATCKVTVMVQMPEAVSLSFDKLVLEVEDERYISAKIYPEGAYQSVTWSSSNNNVITVNSIGLIKAVGEGEATITATTSNGLNATCQVTVKPKGTPATKVTVLPSSISLYVGEESSLNVEILPENVTNKFVTWTSNNEKIATVDSEGKVKALSVGRSIIYAQCGSVSGRCLVNVVERPQSVPVDMIQLDRYQVVAEEGTQFTLTATVLPDNATDKRISWSSDNSNVASVTQSGVVSIKKSGNCIIKAEAVDGSGVYAECHVTATADIADIFADDNQLHSVYTLSGVLVIKAATKEDIKSLAPGYYIIGKQKVLVK